MNAQTETKSGDLVDESKDMAVTDGGGMLALIERMATDERVEPDKLMKILDVKERWEDREAAAEFNRAMNRCQSEIGRVAADANNPQTRSKYATYAALDRALRPVYSRHGFALSFDTGEAAADQVLVLCYVSHESGHSRTYRTLMPADGKGAKGGDVMTKTHAAGSAMSYGMRYLLKLIFNVAIGQDDDGNAAAGKEPNPDAEPATEEQLAKIEEWREAGKIPDKTEQWIKKASPLTTGQARHLLQELQVRNPK